MLYSGKENIFKCLVAFQKMFWKIFSGIWLCSWKYHRKHIFYLLHTFSQLPNKYIISFLNTETQKKQNLEKKIHQIRSYRNTNETKPKKKKFIRLRGGGEIEWRWSQSLLDRRWCGLALVWVGAGVAQCDKTGPWSLDWSSVWGVIWALSSSSLSLSLSLFACESGNGLNWKFWLKPISGSNQLKHTVNWK